MIYVDALLKLHYNLFLLKSFQIHLLYSTHSFFVNCLFDFKTVSILDILSIDESSKTVMI